MLGAINLSRDRHHAYIIRSARFTSKRHLAANIRWSLRQPRRYRLGAIRLYPLIPSLIEAHWFSAGDVVYLGAANLVGYLIGALLGRPMARRLTHKNALRLMMLAVTAAFSPAPFHCR